MDVSSFQSNSQRASSLMQASDSGRGGLDDQHFPDFSLKQLIARLILARGAVVRATNPDLADEYLKFASVFEWNQPGIALRLDAWAKA
jgi:hypothetical protein